MHRFLRLALIWAFSAYFGCLSLLGQGWHCVLTADAHCFAAHAPQAGAGHEHSDRECPDLQASSATAHDDDCPLCRFYSLAQSTADELPFDGRMFVSRSPSPAAPWTAVAFLGAYQSRGPPTAHAS